MYKWKMGTREMKKLILIIMLISLSGLLLAGETGRHGLGFAGGMISGSGFSYRYFGSKNGVQINFAVVSRNDNDYSFPDSYHNNMGTGDDVFTDRYYGRDTFINIGFNYLRPLHSTSKSQFYVLGGAAVYYNLEEYFEQEYVYNENSDIYEKLGDVKESDEEEIFVNFGAGIGISYNLTKNIVIFVDWPLVASFEGDNMGITMAIPQGGIHYFFK